MKSRKFFGLRKKLKPFTLRRVAGTSMVPALRSGQLVIGRRACRVAEGDVVMVNHAGLEKIKRVVGCRADCIYVLGDNPQASTDSREYGWLPVNTVVAKVIWPRLGQKRLERLL